MTRPESSLDDADPTPPDEDNAELPGAAPDDAPRHGGVRVYRFGLTPGAENMDVVRSQMRLAHRYRNTLVEIERGRRAAQRDAESRFGLREAQQALEVARAATEACIVEAKKHRGTTRSRAVPAEMKARIAAARAVEKTARTAFFAKRHELRESGALKAERERIDEAALELKKGARANCGVHWGSYLMVEDAMNAAVKALPLYDGAEPNDPHFVRWEGDGAIGVQVQGGADVADLAGRSTLLRITAAEPPPRELARWARKRARLGDPDWQPREGRGASQHRTLRIRVGSDASRGPVWASFSLNEHREIPPGSVVKRAAVSLRMRAAREEWAATITVELPRGHRTEPCGEGRVAVNIGWRVRPEGALRVAYWRGDDGAHGELALDARTIEGLRKASGLREIRDRAFNAAREALVVFLASPEGATFPEALRPRAKGLASWRSSERMAELVEAWTRASGVRVTREEVEAWHELPRPAPGTWGVFDFAVWCRQERHLWDYERNQAIGALRHRKELYRTFAAGLARKYGVLVMDDFNIAEKVARKPDVTEEDGNEQARSNRQLAAVSELRECLLHGFAARRAEVVRLPAFNQTRTCHGCESVEVWDQAAQLRHTCEKCGAPWDQDENHCENLLRVAASPTPAATSDAPDVGGPAAAAKAPAAAESRWVKVRARADEKRAAKAAEKATEATPPSA